MHSWREELWSRMLAALCLMLMSVQMYVSSCLMLMTPRNRISEHATVPAPSQAALCEIVMEWTHKKCVIRYSWNEKYDWGPQFQARNLPGDSIPKSRIGGTIVRTGFHRGVFKRQNEVHKPWNVNHIPPPSPLRILAFFIGRYSCATHPAGWYFSGLLVPYNNISLVSARYCPIRFLYINQLSRQCDYPARDNLGKSKIRTKLSSRRRVLLPFLTPAWVPWLSTEAFRCMCPVAWC